MTTTPAFVRCHNLIKTFGTGSSKVEALRGVDLEVFEGELLMLVGPSGSGKTTLISVIAGILNQDSGTCAIDGVVFSDMNDSEKTSYRGKHIGFIFQSYNLIPMITAEENVAVPLLINGAEREEALKRSREILIQVGLEDKLKAFPNQLSGGQQQRIAIARGMVHNPDLIVCDEPTSALDHETGHKVLALLKKLTKEQNKTLIVVTHDSRIFEFADRMATLSDGQIVNIK